MLFDNYVKPLEEVIWGCGLRDHQYADDTEFYFSFSFNTGESWSSEPMIEQGNWVRANKHGDTTGSCTWCIQYVQLSHGIVVFISFA